MQRQDRFYIEIVIPAYGWDSARLVRVIAVVDRAYHTVADAGGKQVLGDMRGQADDAGGRPFQRHRPADIANHGEHLASVCKIRDQGKNSKNTRQQACGIYQ